MGQHNDRSNKITRKVNPKFGYLGILGFMGGLVIFLSEYLLYRYDSNDNNEE